MPSSSAPQSSTPADPRSGPTPPASPSPARTMSRPVPTPAPRESLAAAGGWTFLITSFLGRIPSATVQLGLLLYVSGSGLGLNVAGLTVAAVGLGSAVGAPVVGRLVDRWGPLPMVAGATAIQVTGLVAVLAAVTHGAPAGLVLACAAVVGAANPQVGSVARAYWSGLARRGERPGLINRAFGYETACDETSFILGPVIAGLLMGLLEPNHALVALLVWVLVGQGCFIGYLLTHRAAHAAIGGEAGSTGPGEPLGISRALPVMAVCLCVGTIFGSTQTALAAVNAQRGTEAYTGLVYGCMGVGSALASLLVSRLPRSVPLALRVGGGAILVAVTCGGLMSLPSAPVQGVLFAVAGVGVGSMLVSAYSRAEQLAPRNRVATVMTILTTCLVLGVSLGSAVGGVLSVQPERGFMLTLGAALAAVPAAVAMRMLQPGRVTGS